VPTALAVVALATGLGVLDIRTNAWVTGIFVAVEIAALVVLTALGFGHAQRPLAPMLLLPLALAQGGLAPVGPAAIGMAVAVALFAYDGYGAAIYFSEELTQPRRRIGRAVVLALVVVVAAELLPLAGLLAGAPDLKALFGAKSMIGDFVTGAGGAMWSRVISLAVALAIVNAVIALVLLTARQLYCTGRDRTWPAPVNAILTRVQGRLGSPWAATLLAGLLAAGLCFIDLKLLLIATGAGVTLIYAVLCVAVLVGRRNGATAEGEHRAPFHPWLAGATLLALTGVLIANAADPDDGRPALLGSLAVVAVFVAYYVSVIRRRGGWVLAPPPD
jgi:amino acid transporter